MSDLMHNGSSGGARPLPFNEFHDEFLELCALSTTDSLSPDEQARLDRHVADCSACREALDQYRALIAAGVPAASLGGSREKDVASELNWSLEASEAQLFARLENQEAGTEDGSLGPVPAYSCPGPGDPENGLPEVDALWGHIWLQSAAAFVLAVALGYTAYRIGLDRGGRTPQIAAKAPVPSKSLSSPGADSELATAEAAVQDSKAQLADLDARISRQSAEIAALETRNRQSQTDLSSTVEKEASLDEARADLARQLALTQANLEQAQQRLRDVSGENARQLLQMTALRQQIDDLSNSVAARDQSLARAQALLDHDRDIRDLMSSRSLYIAEVYDVARSGQTQKPFGRVFYTKGRSLIFYAYDLDQQPGVRESSTFQAWGSHGPDRADAINLGVFYQDKVASKCWVLKAEDPRALSGIDAVFVTVEPHGGSSHPSGKPLLYAYLHIEPNHP